MRHVQDIFRRRVFTSYGGNGNVVSWILQLIPDFGGQVVLSADTCCHPDEAQQASAALRELSQKLSQNPRPFGHQLVVSGVNGEVSLEFSTSGLVSGDFDEKLKVQDLHLEVVRLGHAGEDNTPMMVRFGHASVKLCVEPNPANDNQRRLSENFLTELKKLLEDGGFPGVEKLF